MACDCSNYTVTFLGATFDGTNTTFRYRVCSNGDPAISHWVLGLPESCATCTDVVATSHAYECNRDPTTRLFGVKFEQGFNDGCRDYWVTLRGYWPTGHTQVAVKAGQEKCYYQQVEGPACPSPVQPGLTLEKHTNGVDADSPTGPVVPVGSTVTWTYEVTNTGNVTLTSIVVTDDQVGSIGTIASLAVGASQTLTKTGTAVAGQYANIGTATTTYSGQTVSDADPSHYFGAAPSIELVKTGALDLGGNGRADAGDTISYTFAVTNTGNVPLTNVTVTDPKVTVVGGPLASLGVGATNSTAFTGTYVLTQADINAGAFTNTATATGYHNGTAVSDTDSDTQTLVTQPAIGITKSASPATATVGDTISYTIVVTNTGNVSLTGVTVTDPKLGMTVSVGTLGAGASHAVTPSPTYVVKESDLPGPLQNTATAEGYYGAQEVTASASASVSLYASPAIGITKSASPKAYSAVGQQITYTFAVTNTGNVTLTNVKIDDARLGVANLAVTPSTLAPGQQGTAQATYTITQGDLDAGSVYNVATGTGTPPTGPNVTGQDDETITATQAPKLSLEKKTNGQDADAPTGPVVLVGSTVTWTYEVTNTGNVTLTSIVVTDDQVGSIGTIASLAVGASQTLTKMGTAVAGQYANIGTATGTYNGTQVSDTDPSHYVGVDGDITITPGSATNEVGDPHTFLITAYAQGAAPSAWGLSYTVAPTPGSESLSGPAVAGDGMSATWNLTINHPSPAVFTAAATVTMTFPGGTQVVRTTDGISPNSAPATKTYEYQKAKIELTPPSDTNEVGDDHVITATVRVWNGTSWVVPPDGGSVTFSIASDTTGTAAIVSTNPAPISGGTAQVTIRATKPGLVKVHAVADVLGTGAVTAETGVGSSGPDAEKTYEYRQAKIGITPLTDTNEVGENHTFTATVEVYVVGTGWVAAPDGTPVTFSFVSNPIGATFVGPSSTTTSGGQAQATIVASQPGQVTVKAQATVGSVTVETNGLGGSTGPATKAYVSGYIAITPGQATNPVGDPHTFVITAHAQGAAPSSWSLSYTVVPTPGSESLSGPTVAPDGMSATWNLTINSAAAGVFLATPTVTMTFPGGTQVVRTTDGLGGSTVPAQKTYVQGRINLSPLSAINEVGDPHTLVALVETTSDGFAWFPTPGVRVTFSIVGGTASFVGDGSTAITTGVGQATAQIVSAAPGTVVIQAVSDLFGDGTFVRTTGTTGNGANASKTYADARISITPLEATNPVGTNHTVTALVEVNAGAGWVPAPDGTPVVFTLLTNAARATFVTASTTTTRGGVTSVTVVAENPGGATLRAITDVTIAGLVLRRETGSGGANSPDALKNWVRNNEPPTAESLSLVTCQNTPLTFSLRGSDPDLTPADPASHPLTFTIMGAPTYGALSGNLSAVTYRAPHEASVDVVYAPQLDFLGTDFITYTVTDPTGAFAVGAIRITVEDCGEEIAGGAGALGPRLVINEIAWGGTAANQNHEWVELYSSFDEPLDLTGWTLRWRRKQPATVLEQYVKVVELAGTIDPDGFYLLERRTDEVVSDIEADLIYDDGGPVVISEIAWGGTPASENDQWIELINVTEAPIDLTGWVLRWRRARPATAGEREWKMVELRGTIAPYATYLLERGSDDVVRGIPADLIYNVPLDPQGEVLELLDPAGEVVDTANAYRIGQMGWAAGYGLGGAHPYATMERVSPFARDTEQNWR
ncbi:MAG: lamin tail domain-containing protein, partial [Coriobacteriia bacterium]|nr:lamin tail domain-containing protein [Coriobacteriia bacterium]